MNINRKLIGNGIFAARTKGGLIVIQNYNQSKTLYLDQKTFAKLFDFVVDTNVKEKAASY